MSQGMYKEKINFLLYLDDPIQAEIADYLSELSPSRKGEVLRQIITTGWTSFKKQMNLEVETVTRVRKKPKPKAKPAKNQESSAPSASNKEPDNDSKQDSLASRFSKLQGYDKTEKEEKEAETIASTRVNEDASEQESNNKEEQKDIRPIKKISSSPLIEDDEDDDEDDMSKLFGKIRSSH